MSQNLFTINRRNFVASLGAFSCGAAFGIDLAPRADFKGEVKGRRLKLAAVGSGGMGGAATASLISAGCDLVAVCLCYKRATTAYQAILLNDQLNQTRRTIDQIPVDKIGKIVGINGGK